MEANPRSQPAKSKVRILTTPQEILTERLRQNVTPDTCIKAIKEFNSCKASAPCRSMWCSPCLKRRQERMRFDFLELATKMNQSHFLYRVDFNFTVYSKALGLKNRIQVKRTAVTKHIARFIKQTMRERGKEASRGITGGIYQVLPFPKPNNLTLFHVRMLLASREELNTSELGKYWIDESKNAGMSNESIEVLTPRSLKSRIEESIEAIAEPPCAPTACDLLLVLQPLMKKYWHFREVCG